MKLKFAPLVFVLFFVIESASLNAQTLPTAPVTPESTAARDAAQKAAIFIEALHLREGAATAIVNGEEKPSSVLLRLKANASPSGLSTESNADFAMAALDVGLRLIAREKPQEAEVFFRESEKSFTLAFAKVPAANVRDQAMILQKLALIRGRYLNEAAQAQNDIDAAVKLQPDEKYFQNFRDGLIKNGRPKNSDTTTTVKG